MFKQRLDQVIGGVVALGVVSTQVEREGRLARGQVKGGFKLEQALVDGTEFLDVERRIVDADRLFGGGMGVEAQRA